MTDILDKLHEVASRYGENNLVMTGGAKSSVGIGERYVFKVVEGGKIDAANHKEQRVLQTLADSLPRSAARLIPTSVDGVFAPGLGYIEVQTRLRGITPQFSSPSLPEELGTFLKALHAVPAPDGITEFEGDDPRPLFDYLVTSALKFQAKLMPAVNQYDQKLVTAAVGLVRRYVDRHDSIPPLVIVHKDLSLRNLLVDDGHLSGVIDWAAAQTAPREWEFAILMQRFPVELEIIQKSYGQVLDNELTRCCAALQAIRFWKSFMDDSAFVNDQRALLEQVL
ncbi:aminoglycoside phosphotransferase family protein [Nocardia arizonensis]|uniref:aminoglycoside phosphotransferase family protein n=1 Tax=Nocardia arizonensis TaxID=1141647 RepID=UPI0009E7806E|nr:aminoglycoside phosphotransferase family protein [Nocardia arizonensis]